MSDNKHAGRGGKGYYIALILCAAAIGITSYVYYRNANRVEEVSIQESVGEDILVGTMESEDVPALATQPQTQSTPPATQGTTPAPTAKKPFKTTSPVSGEEISAYSMEALSYNETTRDWRVHNGVDIAADAGTEVCAAADGEVYTVYEDDSMGYTVVIRHDGGYLTRYASLSQDIPVKSGDTVSAGWHRLRGRHRSGGDHAGQPHPFQRHPSGRTYEPGGFPRAGRIKSLLPL